MSALNSNKSNPNEQQKSHTSTSTTHQRTGAKPIFTHIYTPPPAPASVPTASSILISNNPSLNLNPNSNNVSLKFNSKQQSLPPQPPPSSSSSGINIRNTNRHTVALPSSDFESFFHTSKVTEFTGNDKSKLYTNQQPHHHLHHNQPNIVIPQYSNVDEPIGGGGDDEISNNSSITNLMNYNSNSPLSPDSQSDLSNWLTANESRLARSGGGAAGRQMHGGERGKAESSGSAGTTLGDSDHEMLESSATGLSGSGSGGIDLDDDEPVDEDEPIDDMDDELDSSQPNLILTGANKSIVGNTTSGGSSNAQASSFGLTSSSGGAYNVGMSTALANILNDELDDLTTKRLKTFVATTLHNERVYLDKIIKLLKFKTFLESNFNGSQADISVLFSNIQKIYTTHDIFVTKLEECLSSLTDILANAASSSQTQTPHSSPSKQANSSANVAAINDRNNVIAMKEIFLSNALQLLANIMQISFQVYLEFLKNYSKSMTILNKLETQPALSKPSASGSSSSAPIFSSAKTKSFIECQQEYSRLLREASNTFSNTAASASGAGSSSTALTPLNAAASSNITSTTLAAAAASKKRNFLFKFGHSKASISQTAANSSSPTMSPSSTSKSSTTANNNTDPLNLYYNDASKSEETFDTARIFSEEILRRPTKLFEFIISLKDECQLAANELPKSSSSLSLQSRIKSLFENDKLLRDEVFDQINRNIMPKEVRKQEDVVELSENNNERKLRHLVLYGDCLVCCRLKKLAKC
jgi:hypothetical protein